MDKKITAIARFDNFIWTLWDIDLISDDAYWDAMARIKESFYCSDTSESQNGHGAP